MPVAVDDSATSDEEILVTIDVLANDSDADFDMLTVTDVSQPANGTAVIVNNGSDTQFIEYTSSVDFDGGTDTFTYSISDGAGGSATATVVVTVNAVNDIPNAVDDNPNTVQNTAIVIDVLANDIDENTLSLENVTQPVSGTAVINGSQILYTPPTDFIGSETFGYVATDGSALSNFALVEVTVNTLGSNTPPTVSAGDDMVISILLTADLNGVANDDGLPVTPGTLTILWTQISGPGTTTFGDDSAAATTASFSTDGVYILELSADDGEFTVSDQVMVTVTANASPIAVDDTATTSENVAILIDVLVNDSDDGGDSLTVDSVTDPANGSVANNGSDVTYTPDTNFNGTDGFDYTISDGNGGFDTATVTITVTVVNDVPDAGDDNAITDEDTAVIIDVLANDSDLDGDSLSLDSITQPVSGTAVISGTVVVYTPTVNFNGSDSFTYTVDDGNGGTDTAVVTITVTPLAGDILHLSANTSSNAGSVTYRDEDIISYDAVSDEWEMVFDGSDVGLTTGGEDVDGISFTLNGRLVISTAGNSRVPQTGGGNLRGYDDQLLVFNEVSFGNSTAGDWELYFDGRDVGLKSEDIGGTWLDAATGDIYLSVKNGFSVNGVSGNQLDIFVCHPITLGEDTTCTFEPMLYFDGSAAGYGGNRIDGFSIMR